MTYKLDDNVPLPEANTQSSYPFAEMQVGQSFFAPGKTTDQLSNAAGHWRKKKGMKFTIRKTVENDIAGARCWRTE